MVRKKIDNRLRVMIENGVAFGHRTLFVIVGDKGRDQVVILHHMLSKSSVKSRPSVLWCFKKELGFSSHRQKKMKSLQKKIKVDAGSEDPFELFVASTTIRFCYYKDTHKILGNTYGMCVLQDFEALTPNLLARTMETVEGGGIIVLLLKSVTSLRQLFTLSMDVHARYRTEAHTDVVGRFNERFILSLASNKRCVVIDDSLNVLPLSSHIKNVEPVVTAPHDAEDEELKLLREKFQDTQPTGSLLAQCRTLDQAKALLQFIDAITDKKLDRTVSLTAARGRGKSAALGLAIAAAVGFGYTNIFVTSPSPENLHTLFQFVFKGFDAMGYDEHTDYDLVQSVNPELHNSVVRINVHEKDNHRQTIQYLHPADAHKLGQAELLVIDEAAAIPLPLVKSLLGPYLVFISSTINGYEGTGRSLSLKLIDQLRTQSASKNASSRSLTEVTLNHSIRYRPGDHVESWLNKLLCLDVSHVTPIKSGCPPKEECDLYYINRDTLFCYHRAAEAFLQRIMSLFVASHYKNTPNDLQMMSDAPAHHLFCLLGPTPPHINTLPEVLCVVQVCLEGAIAKQSILHGLSRGKRSSGDLIPWTMAQQFQDDNFPGLSGARIVRIATHPDYQRMGYGSRALELLQRYYEMKVPSLEENGSGQTNKGMVVHQDDEVGLLEESIAPRNNLPPLLLKLSERRPETLDWLGVSYGLTPDLLRFWKKSGYVPTYLRQTPNDLTGEHSLIMLKLIDHSQGAADHGSAWLPAFLTDFRKRLVSLLGFEFRKFTPALALSVLSTKVHNQPQPDEELSLPQLSIMINAYDLRRLELYCNNMADYHLVTDLAPGLARLIFLHRFGRLHLSALQQAILVGVGLQFKNMDELAKELDLPTSQLLGLFNAMLRKMHSAIRAAYQKDIATSLALPLPSQDGSVAALGNAMQPLSAELDQAANELKQKQQEELTKLKHMDLASYQIKGSEQEWQKVLGPTTKAAKNLVSVKTGEKRLLTTDPAALERDAQPAYKHKKQNKKHVKGRKSSI